MKKSDIIAKAEEIYNKKGQTAVFDFANKHNVGYAYCEPCETDSPSIDNCCLVCGSPTVDIEYYYQPDFADENFDESILSFQVYRSEEKAQEDFPKCKILKYSGDDIENLNYVD